MKAVWEEWVTLYRILIDAQTKYFPDIEITAPFMSADSGSHDAPHRLLYVGQATFNSWYDKELLEEHILDTPLENIINERQRRNREAISGEYWGSGFWLTFREMSKKLGNESLQHSNALWSNLAKIGVSSGNPKGLLFSMQADLAARTLVLEIVNYQPTVVVFVTGKYGSSVVLSATQTKIDDWRKTEDDPKLKFIDNEVWWIPRNVHTCTPAYLWTTHPSRGISKARRNFWTEAAFQLSEGHQNIN